MAYKKFSDFVIFDPPDVNDYLVGYRELGGEFRATIADISELFQRFSAPVLPFTLFVNMSGDDASFGTSDAFAFRTIKRAMAKALEYSRSINSSQWLIEQDKGWGTASNPVVVVVKSGEYVEDNPIYVPPGVSLVGDGLKSVTIIPKNKFYDILWVNNQTYIENISFKDYYSPAYAVAYPEFGYLDNNTVADYPSTRITSATARAATFYAIDQLKYPATKPNKASLENFAIDNGSPIYDPFRIAFLNRYFIALTDNYSFYTQAEQFQNLDFWQTAYYNLTSTVQQPYILLAPYINTCFSKTQTPDVLINNAGGSVYVDGYKANGVVKSMIVNNFESFNEGGRGVYVTNNGFANIMGLKSTCCNEAIYVDNGGSCVVNNSNILYGLSGLVAVGKSPRATIIGTLKETLSSFTNKLTITNLGSPTVTGRQEFSYSVTPFAGQIFSIVDRNYIVVATGLNYLTATNSGTYFTVQSASPLRPAPLPYSGYECDLILENYYNYTEDTSLQNLTYAPLVTGFNTGAELPAGALTSQGVDVLFYNRSSIIASSQNFNNVGSGTLYISASPQYGGVGNEDLEIKEFDGGQVYCDSINERGNFKVGHAFKYDESDRQLIAYNLSSYNTVTTNLTALSANTTKLNAIDVDLINLTVSNLISALSANFYNLYVNSLTSNFSQSNNSFINTLVVANFSALSANFQSTQVQSSTGLDITGNVSISGNLNVGGTINGNEFLYNSLESPTLTGIKQALNELLYTPVSISYFFIEGSNTNVIEIGTSIVTPLNLEWKTTKPSAQAITQYNLRLPNSQVLTNTYTFSTYIDNNLYGTYFNSLPGTNSQVLTTWSLTATDWKGNRAISTASIAWQSKIYWGVSNNTTPSDFEIRNNAIHQQLATSRFDGGAKTLNPANQYYYVAYPQRFGLLSGTPKIRVNGANDDTDISRVDIITFVNASGGTDSYYVYRSNNLLTGSYTIQIVS